MKKIRIIMFAMFVGALPLATLAGEIAVTSVTAQQRYPGDGVVDIVVTMQGAAEDVANVVCSFAASNGVTKATIPVEHITRNGEDVASNGVVTRKYIWDAKIDVGEVKIDDVALTVDVEPPYVQLWKNGPYWAKFNVGATKPEDSGYYFWWGDTVGYKRNANSGGWVSEQDATSFSFSTGNCPTYNKSISQLRSSCYIDTTGNLAAAHDAATAHLKAPWRMPTDAEFVALINNCTTIWATRNGVAGRLVTGKGEYSSKSIFLPAAGGASYYDLYGLGSDGRYWSSTPCADDPGSASLGWSFGSSDFDRFVYPRYCGHSVRPVQGFADVNVVPGGVITRIALDCRPLENSRVSVTGVTAQQRDPRDGKVDITVTMQGSAEDVAKADCFFAATNGTTKAEIPVEHITRNGEDTGSGTTWTRKFIWDARADVTAERIDDVVLTIGATIINGVKLWDDGPYWAECNVGASQPEEYGYYFWWGDTVGYKRNANNNGWISVKDPTGFSFDENNRQTYGKNESQLRSEGYIDTTGNLVAKYDAATEHIGVLWRMPTDVEFSALSNNCTTTWTTRNGVFGQLVTGKGAYVSRSIFLPAAGSGDGSNLNSLGSSGCYWSSTPDSDHSPFAWYLRFNSGKFYQDIDYRFRGKSVRPVRGSGSPSAVTGGVTTCLSLDFSVSVLNVEAQQRYPRDGRVDIVVTLEGSADDVAKCECLFVATNTATKTAISVVHVSRNGNDTCSGGIWTRRFIWDAAADVGAVKIYDAAHKVRDVALAVRDVELSVRALIPIGGVQLWENGPYWAECNVGAANSYECGYYFWWGDSVGYKQSGNRWDAVDGSQTGFLFLPDNCPIYGMSCSQLQTAGYIDSTGNLVAAHDAATAHLGTPWRMPTDADFLEMISNCTTTWTTRYGVAGRLVTGKGAYALKSIFLPAAGGVYRSALYNLGSYGEYWSSTPSSDDSNLAGFLDFGSDAFRKSSEGRHLGSSVRPLRPYSSGMGTLSADVTIRFVLDGQECAGESDSSVMVVEEGDFRELGAKRGVDGLWIESGWVLAYVGVANGEVVIPEGVVGIASYAFCDQPNLERVKLPSTLRSIGDRAFYGDCELIEADLPCSVANIGSEAFATCDLRAVRVPSSVTNIGDRAYSSCSFMRYVSVTNVPAHIGRAVFEDCRPAEVKLSVRLGSSGFSDLFPEKDGATKFEIMGGATSIPANMFYGRGDVREVVIADGIWKIGDLTFAGCTNLVSVEVPDSVTQIGESSFEDCRSLKSFVLPDTNVTIRGFAFRRCSGLERFVIPAGRQIYFDGKEPLYGCGPSLRIDFDDDASYVYSGNGEFYWPNVCGPQTLGDKTAEGSLGCFPWSELASGHAFTYVCRRDQVQNNSYRAAGTAKYTPPVILRDDAWIKFSIPDRTSFSGRLTVQLLPQNDQMSIRYTVDGSEPTVDSPVYKGAFPIRSKTTVKAVGFYNGMRVSKVVSARYGNGIAEAPVIQFVDGGVITDPVVIPIACPTEGCTVHYTLDGSVPTEASPVYRNPIIVSSDVVIKAIACGHDACLDSEIATCTVYRKYKRTASPVITVDGGTVFDENGTDIVLSCPQEGVQLYYTTNDLVDLSGNLSGKIGVVRYQGPLHIKNSCCLRAVAVYEDWLTSEVSEVELERYFHKTAMPEMTPEKNIQLKVMTDALIQLSCETAGSRIYYTLDGSDPRVKGIEYDRPIQLNVPIGSIIIVRAFARRDEWDDSEVLEGSVIREWTLGDGAGFADAEFTTDEALEPVTIPMSRYSDDSHVLAFPGMSLKDIASVTCGTCTRTAAPIVNGEMKLLFIEDMTYEKPEYVQTSFGPSAKYYKAGMIYYNEISFKDNGGSVYARFTSRYTVEYYAKPILVYDYKIVDDGTRIVIYTYQLVVGYTQESRRIDPPSFPSVSAVKRGVELGWNGSVGQDYIRSGYIGDNAISRLDTTVSGPGIVMFSWKTQCEHDEFDEFYYDHAEFCVDGVAVKKADGVSDWNEVEYEIAEDGEHVLSWLYVKDDWEIESIEDDGVFLRDVKYVRDGEMKFVRFDLNGGAGAIKDKSVSRGGKVGKLEVPARKNYEFAGWFTAVEGGALVTEDTVVEDDVVFYAHWTWAPQDATVEASITGGKELKIEADWVTTELEQRFGAGKAEAFRAKYGADLSGALAKKTGKVDGAGNELSVWQDYVAGTDPTDENDVFRASITIVEGQVKISWTPELDAERLALRKYTTWGKKSLMDADWAVVPAGSESEFNFFKVSVEMR